MADQSHNYLILQKPRRLGDSSGNFLQKTEGHETHTSTLGRMAMCLDSLVSVEYKTASQTNAPATRPTRSQVGVTIEKETYRGVGVRE